MLTTRPRRHRKKPKEEPFEVETRVWRGNRKGEVIEVKEDEDPHGSKHVYEVQFDGKGSICTYDHEKLKELIDMSLDTPKRPVKKRKSVRTSSSGKENNHAIEEQKTAKDPSPNTENNGKSITVDDTVVDLTTDDIDELEVAPSSIRSSSQSSETEHTFDGDNGNDGVRSSTFAPGSRVKDLTFVENIDTVPRLINGIDNRGEAVSEDGSGSDDHSCDNVAEGYNSDELCMDDSAIERVNNQHSSVILGNLCGSEGNSLRNSIFKEGDDASVGESLHSNHSRDSDEQVDLTKDDANEGHGSKTQIFSDSGSQSSCHDDDTGEEAGVGVENAGYFTGEDSEEYLLFTMNHEVSTDHYSGEDEEIPQSLMLSPRCEKLPGELNDRITDNGGTMLNENERLEEESVRLEGEIKSILSKLKIEKECRERVEHRVKSLESKLKTEKECRESLENRVKSLVSKIKILETENEPMTKTRSLESRLKIESFNNSCMRNRVEVVQSKLAPVLKTTKTEVLQATTKIGEKVEQAILWLQNRASTLR